jgi:hypothetical protein
MKRPHPYCYSRTRVPSLSTEILITLGIISILSRILVFPFHSQSTHTDLCVSI